MGYENITVNFVVEQPDGVKLHTIYERFQTALDMAFPADERRSAPTRFGGDGGTVYIDQWNIEGWDEAARRFKEDVPVLGSEQPTMEERILHEEELLALEEATRWGFDNVSILAEWVQRAEGYVWRYTVRRGEVIHYWEQTDVKTIEILEKHLGVNAATARAMLGVAVAQAMFRDRLNEQKKNDARRLAKQS